MTFCSRKIIHASSHLYGSKHIFYTDKRGISYGCIARRDYMYRLTRPIALANATTCVAQRDLSCDKT